MYGLILAADSLVKFSHVRSYRQGERAHVTERLSWGGRFGVQYSRGELGIQWARRSGAMLVGLGIIDAPTISKPEPVPIGGSAYKVHHDATLLTDASHKVGQFLEHCAQRCTEADVACQILQ